MNFLEKLIRDYKTEKKTPSFGALEILKFVGPGLLVTVGFIDPGNWAANMAAGAGFGYALLWMISLGTIMLIILQHNVAHLGIATGLCLSEATTRHIKPKFSRPILASAMIASVSTSLAEILGGAIALDMLFGIPIKAGAILVAVFAGIMLYTNAYRLIEKLIIAFVSIIGLSFIYELALANVDFGQAAAGLAVPAAPPGSIMILMSVLGAVVMPHNLFLHSEIIQSRQWNRRNEKIKQRQLKYEFLDTLFSMIVGWAINSAMIMLAAAVFFKAGIAVSDLAQAKELLAPLLGINAGLVFAIALLFAGLASTITSGMAAGTIFAGIFDEPYDIKDKHTQTGVAISLFGACALIFLISDPFSALLISQMILGIQLPITIFLQVHLTSSEKVMGKYKNSQPTFYALMAIGIVVTILNVLLFLSFFGIGIT